MLSKKVLYLQTKIKNFYHLTLMTIMKRHMGATLLMASLVANGLLVAGCTNNDYDFNQIDATMGFGGNELQIPTNSTMEIPLKDILELEENGCVVIDPLDSSYVFRRQGDAIDPVHPFIDKIVIMQQKAISSDVILTLSSAAKGRSASNITLHGEDDIYTFNYIGDKPESVVELTHADVSSNIQMEINLTALSSLVTKLDKLVLTFPEYMEVTCSEGSLAGNVLTLTNIPTSQKLKLNAKITGLDFTKGGSSLTVGDKINMTGKVHMYAEASNITPSSTSPTQYLLRNELTMSSVTVESATGRFDPSIDLTELGKVNITGIPDFLSGSNVTVDLYNPVIKLDVYNDMPLGGTLSGTLKGYKNGTPTSVVNVSDIDIAAGKTTMAYICRRGEGMPIGDGIVVKEVENLSNIIEPIPDEITFDANAHADSDTPGTFALGHTYTVAPSYSIEAPIAFDEDAVIEYNKSWDGWNDELKDVELSDGAYVYMTATALNKIPATLSVEATPIDTEGSDMSSLIEVDIKQGTVAASADGKTAVSSPLEIVIREKVKGALKKLDGLEYKVIGEASHDGNSVTGITLNARGHTLKLNDIKIKIVGRVIGDFN